MDSEAVGQQGNGAVTGDKNKRSSRASKLWDGGVRECETVRQQGSGMAMWRRVQKGSWYEHSGEKYMKKGIRKAKHFKEKGRERKVEMKLKDTVLFSEF